MSKIWIATVVETGETCDGKARVLGAFKSKAAAIDCVHKDMDAWFQLAKTEGVEISYDKMRGWYDYDTSDGFEWNVSETELEV